MKGIDIYNRLKDGKESISMKFNGYITIKIGAVTLNCHEVIIEDFTTEEATIYGFVDGKQVLAIMCSEVTQLHADSRGHWNFEVTNNEK